MNLELLVAGLIVISIIFFVLAFYSFNYLERIKKIPIVYDAYTEKKDKAIFYEYLRLFFFVAIALGSILFWNLTVFVSLLFLTGIQFILFLLKVKEKTKNTERIEFVYTEREKEEWVGLVTENGQATKLKIWNKLLLKGDTLYLSKRKKVLLHDKMYHYVFLNRIEIKEKQINIFYGFLGLPLWMESIYIPTSRKKEMKDFIEKVQKGRIKKRRF